VLYYADSGPDCSKYLTFTAPSSIWVGDQATVVFTSTLEKNAIDCYMKFTTSSFDTGKTLSVKYTVILIFYS